MPQVMAGVLVGLASGCGPGKVPDAWIAERAAVVHCTGAGPLRMPPVMLDLPVPRAPSGLFARGLDPLALDALGFERDTTACAVLEAPRPEAIAASREAFDELIAAQTRFSVDAGQVAGWCTCETAEALGLRGLLLICHNKPTRPECDPERWTHAFETVAQPVIDALSRTPVPLVHWRLVGRTDRPGWFVDHFRELLGRHPGGSTVYVPGAPIPRRNNAQLVTRLFEEDGVVAVVRQDNGRALLVVRELGKQLVFDHFAYPAVDGVHKPWLELLDSARVGDYVAALAKPETRRKLALDPEDGNLVEVDRPLLEALDAWIDVGAVLAGTPGAEATEPDAPLLVDRVTLQAPFGADGTRLVGEVRLSEAGVLWAQALSPARLSPGLDELNLPDAAPAIADQPGPLPYLLQGTSTHTVLFFGLHGLAEAMPRVEMEHPGAIRGDEVRWRFELPASDLAEVFPGSTVLSRLREVLARQPHALELQFDAAREVIRLDLQPR
jgi:hypothetical protein